MLSTADVARLLDLDTRTIREAIRRGELTAGRRGNAIEIAPEAFEQWVQACRVAPAGRRR